MTIRVFELPPLGTNTYLLFEPKRSEAVVIDASHEALVAVQRALKDQAVTITALLLTHGHWDHIVDAWRFSELGVPTYGHPKDAFLFDDPRGKSLFAPQNLDLRPCKIDHALEDGQVLELLGTRIEVRHVPGHSPGSVLFYLPEAEMAITGDLLFAGSVGRTDLPMADFDELAASIRNKIFTLPPETELFPGHGPATSVATERSTNPYVSSTS